MRGSSAIWHVSYSIHKLAEGMLCPIIQVINAEVCSMAMAALAPVGRVCNPWAHLSISVSIILLLPFHLLEVFPHFERQGLFCSLMKWGTTKQPYSVAYIYTWIFYSISSYWRMFRPFYNCFQPITEQQYWLNVNKMATPCHKMYRHWRDTHKCANSPAWQESSPHRASTGKRLHVFIRNDMVVVFFTN